MRVSVILPAAGLGTRMGKVQPEKFGTSRKQFMLLEGDPILIHTIRRFASSPHITEIVVALRQEDLEWVADRVRRENLPVPVRFVEGGDTRQQSVANALASLDPGTDLVAIHDAVRPFISPEIIAEVLDAASKSGAAIVGIVPVDTVKEVHKDRVRGTISRERLVLAQTPQVFQYRIIREAFEKAIAEGFTGTDEASLVERLEQVEVVVVPGSDRNIKITRPSDLDLAQHILAGRSLDAEAE